MSHKITTFKLELKTLKKRKENRMRGTAREKFLPSIQKFEVSQKSFPEEKSDIN